MTVRDSTSPEPLWCVRVTSEDHGHQFGLPALMRARLVASRRHFFEGFDLPELFRATA